MKEVSLKEKHFEEIKRDLEGYSNGHFDSCLCGYYEFRISGIGYLTIEVHCRKVSGCPKGMNWFVEDRVRIWDSSMGSLGYVPEDENEAAEDGIELIGYLDEICAEKVKEIIREDIIANHTWNNTDEYGREIDYSIEHFDDEVGYSDGNYDYQKAYEYLLGYLVNLEASCSNCGSNGACCVECKNGKQMWTFNHELLEGIEKFRV